MIENSRKILSMLFHSRRTFAHARFPMTAQVRKNQAITGDQLLCGGMPELVIGGKRMKQNDRSAAPQNFIENFCVAAGDPLHALEDMFKSREGKACLGSARLCTARTLIENTTARRVCVRTRVVPPGLTSLSHIHPALTCRAITFRPFGAGIRWFDSTWFPKKSVLTHTARGRALSKPFRARSYVVVTC